jgi:hypothetical protein
MAESPIQRHEGVFSPDEQIRNSGSILLRTIVLYITNKVQQQASRSAGQHLLKSQVEFIGSCYCVCDCRIIKKGESRPGPRAFSKDEYLCVFCFTQTKVVLPKTHPVSPRNWSRGHWDSLVYTREIG